MGLTIHYCLHVPENWTQKTIRERLEAARAFAKTLPVVSVSDLVEFHGQDADFQHVRESGQEEKDEFFWAKIQAQRSLLNPWEPGTHGSQSPSHMLVFSVDPAEGCEPMNVGICSYRQHIWKARHSSAGSSKCNDHVPAWSLVFDERHNSYPESRKVMREFLRQWNLRRIPEAREGVSSLHRFGGAEKGLHYADLAQTTIQRGRYVSHRQGYVRPFGMLRLRDRMKYELCFRYHGPADQAEKVLSSPEFIADLNRIINGADHITPAVRGRWSSFVKTQYANDPRCGGWANFAQAHLSVCGILDYMQGLGFEVEVVDEGRFWDDRNLEALAKTIGQWDAFIAGMAGVMKDAAEQHGLVGESAMTGRPDFETLEATAHTDAKVGELLKKIKGAV